MVRRASAASEHVPETHTATPGERCEGGRTVDRRLTFECSTLLSGCIASLITHYLVPSRKRTKFLGRKGKARFLLHVALPLLKLLHCNYVERRGMFLDGQDALTRI